MPRDLLLRVALVLAVLLAVIAACAGSGPRARSLHRPQPAWPTTSVTPPVRLLPVIQAEP